MLGKMYGEGRHRHESLWQDSPNVEGTVLKTTQPGENVNG